MQAVFASLTRKESAGFRNGWRRVPKACRPFTFLPIPKPRSQQASSFSRRPRGTFADRFEFGEYLNDLLAPLDQATISNDRGLWCALAIVWFDQLCPPNAVGRRKVEKEYRYILSADYRHFYRHLVRSPWQLARDHGENSKFLLLAPAASEFPLRRHGEILEQLGGRQFVLGSKPVIAEASKLYSDVETGRPLRGVSGSGKGSVRRLALVLKQFDLTFDSESMESGALLRILPKEFDRWNESSRAAA